jgi:hypothetical protein
LCAPDRSFRWEARWKARTRAQAIDKVRIYPGADSGFYALRQTTAMTYAYEKGAGAATRLHWDEAAKRLTEQGPAAWSAADSGIVEVMEN